MSAPAGPAPFATLARVEAMKLARLPTTLVLAAILLAYLLLMGVSFYALLSAPEVEGFDRDAFVGPIRAAPLPFAMSLFASTASITIIVLAATTVGNEFSRGTLRTLLLAGVTRRGFLASKLAVLLVVSVLVGLAGTAFTFGAIAAFGAALGETLLPLTPMLAAWTFLGLVLTFYGWSSLAAVGTAWRGSLGLGIGAAMGLLIVGDIARDLLGGMGTAGTLAGRILPNAAFNALTAGRAPPASDWAWILPNLALWLVVLPMLAARRLEKVDAVGTTRA